MWYRCEEGVITLALHIQPGAKRSAVAGLHGDALKIRLAAPAIEGLANEALLNLIADHFKVPLRNVELKRGKQSRCKSVIVRDSAVKPESLLFDER